MARPTGKRLNIDKSLMTQGRRPLLGKLLHVGLAEEVSVVGGNKMSRQGERTYIFPVWIKDPRSPADGQGKVSCVRRGEEGRECCWDW